MSLMCLRAASLAPCNPPGPALAPAGLCCLCFPLRCSLSPLLPNKLLPFHCVPNGSFLLSPPASALGASVGRSPTNIIPVHRACPKGQALIPTAVPGSKESHWPQLKGWYSSLNINRPFLESNGFAWPVSVPAKL